MHKYSTQQKLYKSLLYFSEKDWENCIEQEVHLPLNVLRIFNGDETKTSNVCYLTPTENKDEVAEYDKREEILILTGISHIHTYTIYIMYIHSFLSIVL